MLKPPQKSAPSARPQIDHPVAVPVWTGSVEGVSAVRWRMWPVILRGFVRCDEDNRVGGFLRSAEASFRNLPTNRTLFLWRARETGQHAGMGRTGATLFTQLQPDGRRATPSSPRRQVRIPGSPQHSAWTQLRSICCLKPGPHGSGRTALHIHQDHPGVRSQLCFGGTKFGPFRSKSCFLSRTNSSTVMGVRLPMTSMRLFVPWKMPFW